MQELLFLMDSLIDSGLLLFDASIQLLYVTMGLTYLTYLTRRKLCKLFSK